MRGFEEPVPAVAQILSMDFSRCWPPATQFNLYNNHYSRISFKILVFVNYCYIFVSLFFFPLPRDHQKEKEMSIGLYGALRGRQPFQILCKAKSSLTMSVASRNT